MITKELDKLIREIIKDEVYSLFFIKKPSQIPLKSYIKHFVFEEISKRKVKPELIEYLVDEEEYKKNSNSFFIDFTLPLERFHSELLKQQKINCDYKHFIQILKGELDDKICWIDKARRSRGYQIITIFDFLDDVSNADLHNLNSYNRRALTNFVVGKFSKNGVDLIGKNIGESFNRWLKKK